MTLIIPGTSRPSNLHYGDDIQVEVIDSDLYDICERIKEVSPDLFIVAAKRADSVEFTIMERCKDGVDRYVYSTPDLDARIVEKCRYMLHVPLAKRADIAIAEADKAEQDRKEAQSDALYESLGRPMWTQLEHDGFIDGRNVSYNKMRGGKRG